MTEPIILSFFANDLNHSLQLSEEAESLNQTFFPFDRQKRVDYQALGHANIETLYQRLRHYRKELIILHYGGHSNENTLFLEKDEQTRNFTNLLKLAPNLHLVFLNGCANKGLVDSLLSAGVKVVIGTSATVGDKDALDLASLFYKNLAQEFTIEEAFKSAKAQLKDQGFARGLVKQRGARLLNETNETSFPWGLYYNEPESLQWKIPAIPPRNPALRRIRERGKKICQQEVNPINRGQLSEIQSREWKIFQSDLFVREGNGNSEVWEGDISGFINREGAHTYNKLLILGEAGTGKTVALCQYILSEYDSLYTETTPVYFHLSSWKNNLDMQSWINYIMRRDYEISKSRTHSLQHENKISYCFDGLDELDEDLRASFIQGINDFDGEVKIIISCRLNEFENLEAKSNKEQKPFRNFERITLLSLSKEKVNGILENTIGEKIVLNEKLFGLVKIPLFLKIFVEIYQFSNEDERKKLLETSESDELWDRYLKFVYSKKFPDKKQSEGRDITPMRYKEQELKAWSNTLARKMQGTSFFIEDLQPDWLLFKTKNINLIWVIYILLSRLSSGLLISVSVGFLLGSPFEYFYGGILGGIILSCIFIARNYWNDKPTLLSSKINFQLIWKYIESISIYALFLVGILYSYFGLVGNRQDKDRIIQGIDFFKTDANLGFVFGFVFVILLALRAVWQNRKSDIRLVEKQTFNRLNFWTTGVIMGISTGLFFGVSGEILYFLGPLKTGTFYDWINDRSLSYFWAAFGTVAPVGFVVGLFMGWSKGSELKLDSNEKEGNRSINPNHGMRKTLINSVIFTGVLVLFMSLYFVFGISTLFDTKTYDIFKGIKNGLGIGLFMLIWWGGVDFIQHCVLRLIIFLKGDGPLNFSKFFADLEKLGLVKKKGANFQFRHKELQEYLSKQPIDYDVPNQKKIGWNLTICTIVFMLIYPFYIIATDNIKKSLWNWEKPYHNGIALEDLSSFNKYMIHEGVTKKGENEFLIKEDGNLYITVSGKIKLGDFTGYCTPIGTNYAYPHFLDHQTGSLRWIGYQVE